jgi:hypothetical protein
VPKKDVLTFNDNVAIFISDSACLDCHREYISLLFKYFNKEAIIIRLGPILDSQEFMSYRIWGLVGCSELEGIVNSSKPLIAVVKNMNNLEYVFVPIDSDIDLFEKYLVSLRNELNNHH